jgi:hypothetical protein
MGNGVPVGSSQLGAKPNVEEGALSVAIQFGSTYDCPEPFATWLIMSSTRERNIRRSGELLALW